MFPANINLFKTENRNSRKRCKIYSKLKIKTPTRRQRRRPGVFIVDFEHILRLFLVFLFLALNGYMFASLFSLLLFFQQEKLSTCQQSQFKLQKDLVNCKLSNETCSPDNKPYFKHFMRKFSEVMVPLEEDSNYYTMSIMLEKSQYELLRETLNDEKSNLNVVLDMALSGMKVNIFEEFF